MKPLTKTFIKNLAIYAGIVLTVVALGAFYIVASAWLISGVFSTTFTVWQSLKAAVLLWLGIGTYRFINGVKIEK